MDRRRPNRGWRQAKPAVPGHRAALGLRVSAEIKNLIDARAKAAGHSQAIEAERLIELGKIFDDHDRWTLPRELRQLAMELIAAQAGGPGALIDFVMTTGNPDEDERWLRFRGLELALKRHLANHPIRPPQSESETSAAEAA